MTQHHNDILVTLGITDLPKEEQEELSAEIGEIIFLGAMRRVWDMLDYHQQDALMSLLKESEDNPDNEEKRNALVTFLDAQVPEFGTYIRTEAEELKRAQKEALGDTL